MQVRAIGEDDSIETPYWPAGLGLVKVNRNDVSGMKARFAPSLKLKRRRTARLGGPMLDVPLGVLCINLHNDMGVDPEPFGHNRALQDHRFACIVIIFTVV